LHYPLENLGFIFTACMLEQRRGWFLPKKESILSGWAASHKKIGYPAKVGHNPEKNTGELRDYSQLAALNSSTLWH
jgi:hypothetical protein